METGKKIIFVPKNKADRLAIFDNDKRKYRVVFSNGGISIVDAKLAEVYRSKMKAPNGRVKSVEQVG